MRYAYMGINKYEPERKNRMVNHSMPVDQGERARRQEQGLGHRLALPAVALSRMQIALANEGRALQLRMIHLT